MKCPKCSYLGFETGDRCKNCGYDFSLLAGAPAAEPDLPLRRDADSIPGGSADWDRFDHGMGQAVVTPAPSTPPAPLPLAADRLPPPAREAMPGEARPAFRPSGEPRAATRAAASGLPLFQPAGNDDEPLIKLPAAPRAPLSVRRTPDRPRLRQMPKPAGTETATAVAERVEPVLEFAPEPVRPADRPAIARRELAEAVPSAPGKRLLAALLDHAILGGIDLTVVYFTVKMAGLGIDEWRALPVAPLAAFLIIIKTAYFAAFTLVGGQTIGKMATGIRVVSGNSQRLEPAQAFQRTLAGALSIVTFGLAFLPAVLRDGRALHDRVAGTRVIELR